MNERFSGIKANPSNRTVDTPFDNNREFILKFIRISRETPLEIHRLFKLPIRYVPKALMPSTTAVNIEDSILVKAKASEKTIVVKYEIDRNTGARAAEIKTTRSVRIKHSFLVLLLS